MVRGIYTAASGMLVQKTNMDVVSNNLANVDTAGYKKDTPHVRAFPELLLSRQLKGDSGRIGKLGTGAVVDGGSSSFLPGMIRNTENPLDVALVGHGFFSVQTVDGPRYTRDGRFAVSPTGWLVDLTGNRVRGENGSLFIGDGEVTIESDGTVIVNGEVRDRLLIVEFPDRDGLVKQGSGLFMATPEAGASFRYQGMVVQGALEMANVNVVEEMVRMITVQRAYEANQKVVQAYDETLGKAVNDIAGR